MDTESVRDFTSAPNIRMAGFAVLAMLALFLLVSTLSEFKSLRFIGSGVNASNTISVSGEGTAFAVPDIATFSVSVRETAKDVATAQKAATKKNNDIIEYLTEAGVAEKDIQTTEYSVNPQYDYSNTSCASGYCPPSNPKLVGYEVAQTLTIKVRETDKAGDVLSGVGSRGASNVSGLSFTIDDEDAVNAEAREKAIEDARTKASELAKQLHVKLVRIVGFSESGNYPYYAKMTLESSAYGRGGAMDAPAVPAPQLPVGENKIVSNVTLTYEIR